MENALYKKIYVWISKIVENLVYFCFMKNYSEPYLNFIFQGIKMIFKWQY